MDSDDKVFLQEISEKLDRIAAQTIDPIEEIRKNIENTVEERLVMITDKLEEMGQERVPADLGERLDEVDTTCEGIIQETKELKEKVKNFQHSVHERVPVDLEERLDQIEFQLKSLTALVSLFCTHFGVNRPKPVGLSALKKKNQNENPEPL